MLLLLFEGGVWWWHYRFFSLSSLYWRVEEEEEEEDVCRVNCGWIGLEEERRRLMMIDECLFERRRQLLNPQRPSSRGLIYLWVMLKILKANK